MVEVGRASWARAGTNVGAWTSGWGSDAWRRIAGAARAGAVLVALAACSGDQESPVTATTTATATAGSGESTPAVSAASSPARPPAPAMPALTPVGSPFPAVPTQPPGPPVAPTPGGTTAVFRSGSTELGPVVWASAVDPSTKAPRTRVEVFPAGAPVLHAALPALHLTRGTSVSASWSYNGTPLDVAPSQVVAERDERETWVEFHLPQSAGRPWPAGVYAIEVQVDGQPAQTAAVLVEG